MKLPLNAGSFSQIVQSKIFQTTVMAAILVAGVAVGLETSPMIAERYRTALTLLDHLIIWIFIVELLFKTAAEGRRPWRYLYDPWNVFDFIIIAAYFLPLQNEYILVLRLVRILRVLKLIRSLPRLRILVGALLKSLPSMMYVSLLLLLLFYTYGVTATFMFADNDPLRFGSLPKSILSLFQIVTLEGWGDIMYTQMYGCDVFGYDGLEELCQNPSSSPVVAALFFVTFVMLGAMIVINLFIGVMTTSLEEAQREHQLEEEEHLIQHIHATEETLEVKLSTLQNQLQAIQTALEQIRRDLPSDGS